MIWFWDHYAPTRGPGEPGRLADPGHDLSGLAPAIILTAEHDLLREEGERYAEAAREGRRAVEHRRFAGQMHGFFTM